MIVYIPLIFKDIKDQISMIGFIRVLVGTETHSNIFFFLPLITKFNKQTSEVTFK